MSLQEDVNESIDKKISFFTDEITRINEYSNDDLDFKFRDEQKKHRNMLSRLDHWFQILIHPFFIISITFLIFIIYLIFRWLKVVHPASKIIIQIENDLGGFIPFLTTTFITYVITTMLDNIKNRKQ